MAKKFDCKNCGADLAYEPGTTAMQCPFCGTQNTIETLQAIIEELDFHEFQNKAVPQEEMAVLVTVKCPGCGAETTLPPNVTSDPCPYCGINLIASEAHSMQVLRPKSVLPFKVNQKDARQNLTRWIQGLWFAPSKLKSDAEKDRLLKGMYVPYWTFDSHTFSNYTGERGEHYWDEEWATVNGKREQRRVQKTRWHRTSGTVTLNFNDVLVLASKSIPRQYADRLEPWDLENLVAFQDDYLAGFRTETYQVDLEKGFEIGKQIMDGRIRSAVNSDIGGDEQRIHSIDSNYDNITFKHVLLPVWIGAYRYQGKVYQFQVNARTGEVQGSRPWSWIKITLLILTILLIILFIILAFSN